MDNPEYKKRSGCFRWGCGITLLCLLIPVIVGFGSHFRTQSKIERRLAKLREDGYPTNGPELDAYYHDAVSGENNLALFWQPLIDACSEQVFIDSARKIPILGADANQEPVPLPGSEWDHLEQAVSFLEQYRALVDQIHEVAVLEGQSRYPYALSNLSLMIGGPLSESRQVSRLLSLEARVRALEGNTDRAFKALHSTAAYSESFRDDPLLVAYLVRIASETIGMKTLHEILPSTNFSDQQLKLLQDVYAEKDFMPSLREALVGERVWIIEGFQNPQNAGLPPTFVLLGPELENHLDLIEQAMETTELPWPRAWFKVQQIELAHDERRAQARGITRWRIDMASLLLTATRPVFRATGRATFTSRSTVVALAAKRYQLVTGEWPESINLLAPQYVDDVPLDPYDGRPLRYFLDEESGLPVIYSVGPDGKDDEAKTDITISNSGNGDNITRLGRQKNEQDGAETNVVKEQ